VNEQKRINKRRSKSNSFEIVENCGFYDNDSVEEPVGDGESADDK